MIQKALQTLLVLTLLSIVYAIDASTGLVPDVSGLYLVPVVLTAYWFGLLPSLATVIAALSADYLLHPEVHRNVIVVHNVTHLMTYAFAASVTAVLRRQLTTIRQLSGRRDFELGVARRLQRAVSERYVLSKDERFDVAARVEPARELGGDQVFVRDTSDGLLVCVADISGKGVSAALFSALLQATIDESTWGSARPELLVERVNARMHATLPLEMFVTMFCGLIGGETLTYVNAGHEPAFVIDAMGTPLPPLLSDQGFPIGINETLSIPPVSTAFASGSSLLMYSDGVTDSSGFGGRFDLIEDYFRMTSSLPAQGIADAILQHASPEGVGQRDDMSVVVVRAL